MESCFKKFTDVFAGQQEVCSGHGDCICGKCKCQQDEKGTYTGRFCEECSVSTVPHSGVNLWSDGVCVDIEIRCFIHCHIYYL